MCDRTIVDTTYEKLLGGGGMGLRWSKESISIMSNIPQTGKSHFSGVKLEVERKAKQEGIKEIGINELERYTLELDKFYQNSLKSEFSCHFKSASKVLFNAVNPYIFMTFGEDNFLKVFHYEQTMPLQIIQLPAKSKVVDVVWLKSNPNCALVATSKGQMSIYDFSLSRNNLVESFEISMYETDEVCQLVVREASDDVVIITKTGRIWDYEIHQEGTGSVEIGIN